LTDDVRNVRITYFAHTRDAPAITVSWTCDARMNRARDEDGPGHILQSTRMGSAGGVVCKGVYWPLHSLKNITWKVEDDTPSQ
jgi:hypothetical protein